MKVTRNGRFTTHMVSLDITYPKAFESPGTDGTIWPSKVKITYQYLYSTGQWYVLQATIIGYRDAARAGNTDQVTLVKPEDWPSWLHSHVTLNTPEPLGDPEMVQEAGK